MFKDEYVPMQSCLLSVDVVRCNSRLSEDVHSS